MENLHTTTRIRKALMAVGATLALSGILAVANPVEAEASEWDERGVSEIQTDIQKSDKLEYEIQWGDTLGNIAQAVNIPLSTLANANGIGNIDVIIAGQTLVISEDAQGHTQVEVQAEKPAPKQEVKQEVKATPAPKAEVKQEVKATPVTETSDARTAFNQIVAEKGLTQSEADGWAMIINRESSWNPQATNPTSGAYGLAQALPASKMSSHGDYTKPTVQLRWMYDYMVNRYGSIQGAVNFWNANHWY